MVYHFQPPPPTSPCTVETGSTSHSSLADISATAGRQKRHATPTTDGPPIRRFRDVSIDEGYVEGALVVDEDVPDRD